MNRSINAVVRLPREAFSANALACLTPVPAALMEQLSMAQVVYVAAIYHAAYEAALRQTQAMSHLADPSLN